RSRAAWRGNNNAVTSQTAPGNSRSMRAQPLEEGLALLRVVHGLLERQHDTAQAAAVDVHQLADHQIGIIPGIVQHLVGVDGLGRIGGPGQHARLSFGGGIDQAGAGIGAVLPGRVIRVERPEDEGARGHADQLPPGERIALHEKQYGAAASAGRDVAVAFSADTLTLPSPAPTRSASSPLREARGSIPAIRVTDGQWIPGLRRGWRSFAE